MAFSILRYLLHIFVTAILRSVLIVFRWLTTILSVYRPKIVRDKVVKGRLVMDKAVAPTHSHFFPWMSTVSGDPHKTLAVLNKRRQEILTELPVNEEGESVSETTVTEWICLLKARDATFREILIQEAKKALNETVVNMLMPLRELRKLLTVDDWLQYRALVRKLTQVLPSEVLQQVYKASHSLPLGGDVSDQPSQHGQELALTEPQSDGHVLDAKNLKDRKFTKKLQFDLPVEPRSDGCVSYPEMFPNGKSRKEKSRMLATATERKAVVSPLRKHVKNVGMPAGTGFDSLKDPHCGFNDSADKVFVNGLNDPTVFITSDQYHPIILDEGKRYHQPAPYGLSRDENIKEENDVFLPANDLDGKWEPLAVSTPLKKSRHSHPVMENLLPDRGQDLSEEVSFQTLAGYLDNMSKTFEELSDSVDGKNDPHGIQLGDEAECVPGLPSFEHTSVSSGVMSFNGDARPYLKGRTMRAFNVPAYLQPVPAVLVEEEMMNDHSHHDDSVD